MIFIVSQKNLINIILQKKFHTLPISVIYEQIHCICYQIGENFIFCYHSVITNGCQDNLPATVFLYHSLFFSDLFNFFKQQKNPQNRSSTGILHLDTTLSCDNKSIFRLYYSMIVATRPDPTVRPPSRYFNPVLPHIFYGFLSKIQ